MLAENRIGDAGAEQLAAALEKNSALTQLNLEGECMGCGRGRRWHGR